MDEEEVAFYLRSGSVINFGVHKEPTEIMGIVERLEEKGLVSVEDIGDQRRRVVWLKQ